MCGCGGGDRLRAGHRRPVPMYRGDPGGLKQLENSKADIVGGVRVAILDFLAELARDNPERTAWGNWQSSRRRRPRLYLGVSVSVGALTSPMFPEVLRWS